MVENTAVRKAFGPPSKDVTGDWRKLHNEELHDFVPDQITVG